MAASWLTTMFGVGAIVVALAQLIAQIIEEGGVPHDVSTWLGFATKFIVGAGIIVSKSFNVSNAPQPTAPAVVSAADAVKVNPSAVK